jgi:hypothetical protein
MFREVHIIWILAGLNTIYVVANIFFIRLDVKSNNGNVEHAKLHDVKEGYKALAQAETHETTIVRSSIQIWRVRWYIFLCGLVLVAAWISFGVVMGYKHG